VPLLILCDAKKCLSQQCSASKTDSRPGAIQVLQMYIFCIFVKNILISTVFFSFKMINTVVILVFFYIYLSYYKPVWDVVKKTFDEKHNQSISWLKIAGYFKEWTVFDEFMVPQYDHLIG